jgi:metal-responsive CopG/Arc/MetJ family transcriptional regulator
MAKQPAPVPVRLSPELLYKFDVVAKAKRRKRGELLRLLAEDEVAAYEKENGPITLPASPSKD